MNQTGCNATVVKAAVLKPIFLLFVMLLGSAFAQTGGEGSSEPVSVSVEAFVVSEVTGEDGNVQEQFSAASTARPGQVVEYRLSVNNQENTTLPAGTVVVTGPVPESTRYAPDSATPSSERVLTEFTADGETYGEPPVTGSGEGTGGSEEIVAPSDYAAVRWTLLTPMEPAQEEVFTYRVVVE